MADFINIDSTIDYEIKSSRPHYDTIYVIIPFAKVTSKMVDSACETSIDTLRHTVSGEDKVILKWAKKDWKYLEKVPSVLTAHSLDSDFKVYSYEEILEELKKPEWSDPDLDDLEPVIKDLES